MLDSGRVRYFFTIVRVQTGVSNKSGSIPSSYSEKTISISAELLITGQN